MKTISESPSETESSETDPIDEENDASQAFNAALRKRAIAIGEEVWPGVRLHFSDVEQIVDQVILLDEEGEVDEDSIAEETENLVASKAWAKDVYGDDAVGATLAAYTINHGLSLSERLDNIEMALEGLKKKR